MRILTATVPLANVLGKSAVSANVPRAGSKGNMCVNPPMFSFQIEPPPATRTSVARTARGGSAAAPGTLFRNMPPVSASKA
jgi:hypothetical protein